MNVPHAISDNPFTISSPPRITVTSPTGGVDWVQDSTHTITWVSQGSIPDVLIEYTTDGGMSWTNIGPFHPNDGSYVWALSSPYQPSVSTNASVRVSDPQSDMSGWTPSFTVSEPPTITLVYPNGGETFMVGEHVDTTWSYQGTIPNVGLEYSSNDGSSWKTIVGNIGNSGTYPWVIPDSTSLNTLLKVIDKNNVSVYGQSIFDFTISPAVPSIFITAPTGTDNWIAGAPHNITWYTLPLVHDLTAEYSYNAGIDWTTIKTNMPNTGSYTWSIPSSYLQTNSAMVRIMDTGGSPSAISPIFTVTEKPSLVISDPASDATWITGFSWGINWDSTGSINSVNLFYSLNNGQTWKTIDTTYINSPGANSYLWAPSTDIVSNFSTQSKIKIVDSSGSTTGISDLFTLTHQSQVNVISPNGTENWKPDSTHTILWNTVGIIDNLKIENLVGLDATVITGSTPNTGMYKWYIPSNAVISPDYRVKISDIPSGDWDISDGSFEVSINSGLQIIYPDGGEDLPAGTTQNILWNTTGPMFGNVKLEYSLNDRTAWTTISDSEPNIGTYAWTVPLEVSTRTFIKVSEIPSISIITPTADTILITQSIYNINWQSVGVDFVNIEYTPDGRVWSKINTVPVSAVAGTYQWTIPEDTSASGQAGIRISDVNN